MFVAVHFVPYGLQVGVNMTSAADMIKNNLQPG